MTALNYGRPIYRHSSRFSNITLKGMAIIGSISLVFWAFIFSANLTKPFISLGRGGWYDPATWLFLLAGVVVFLTFVLFPYLFIPTNFMVTTTGVQTSYSRLSRLLKGHPLFIEYRDIETIFPQFMPGYIFPDGTKGKDLFRSLVIVLKDGRRVEVVWDAAGSVPTPMTLKRFQGTFPHFPDELKEKWSNLPVLSKEQERISRLMDEEGKEDIKTIKQKVVSWIMVIIMLVIVFLTLSMMFEIGGKIVGYGLYFSIFLLVFPLPLLVVKNSRIIGEIHRTKASRKVLHTYANGESIDIVGPNAKLEPRPESVAFEPISREDMVKAMRAIEKYKPLRSRVMIALGIAFLFGGFVFFNFSDEGWISIITTFVLSFVGIVGIVLGFVLFGRVRIVVNTSTIESVLADEVRLGNDLLPADYVLPEWFFMKRGVEPIGRKELDTVRKWAHFEHTQQLTITMCLFMGGMVLSLLFLPLVLIFDLLPAEILMVFLASEIVTIPLGIFFIARTTWALQKLDRIVKWEKRSGIPVLPKDLRERWKRWEATESGKA